jgi:predicted carbohydrate-binding protein with CBM5 and CBM33 domain
MCFEGGSLVPGLWYPPNGVEIEDPACRAVFNHVAAKNNNPRTQFTYRNEYANFNPTPGHNRENYPNIVPSGEICSAGNNFPDRNSPPQFGDKTGMSILAPWRKNYIMTGNVGGYETLKFQYCATAPHNPSVWHVYFQAGDAATTKVTWERLRYLGQIGNIQPKVSPTPLANCFSLGAPHNVYYEFEMDVPMPPQGGTIVVAWQRIDPHGEFFMECIDFQPDGEYVPPPPPPTEGCPPIPNCPANASFLAPTTNPRTFYSCHEGRITTLGCPAGQAFTNFRQCRPLPIAPELRFACQDFSLVARDEF